MIPVFGDGCMKMRFAPGFANPGFILRDPKFIEKSGKVLDLYAKQWEGQPLGADNYVICADEKTSIQARIRKHVTAPDFVS